MSILVAERQQNRGVARLLPARVTGKGVAVEGAPSAPVTIIEFTDYQCPYCGRHARETLPILRREYIDRGLVRYVIRDLPLEIHPNARAAAVLMRCIARDSTGNFWAAHDSLFLNQRRDPREYFGTVAAEFGLTQEQLTACRRDPAIAHGITEDVQAAASAGLSGTPAFVIGEAQGDSVFGTGFEGAFPIGVFRRLIDSMVSRSEAQNQNAVNAVTTLAGGSHADTFRDCDGNHCAGRVGAARLRK